MTDRCDPPVSTYSREEWAQLSDEERGPCDEWTGFRNPKGYGRTNGVLTHRRAWTELVGPIPKGMCVCHHCDNPPCRNVQHLFIGTYADNNRDRDAKGRLLGTHDPEKNNTTKLNWEAVRDIRRRGVRVEGRGRAGPSNVKELANEFNVTPHQIHMILTNRQWKEKVQ